MDSKTVFPYSSIRKFLEFRGLSIKIFMPRVYLHYANIEYGNDINIEWQTIDSYYHHS